VPLPLDFLNLEEALLEDQLTAPIIAALKENSHSKPGYSLVNHRLYYKGRLVIPQSSPLCAKLLEEAHLTPFAGNNFLKMLKRLSGTIYWSQMKADVKTFIQQCLTCQKNKYETLSPAGLLQPIPIPTQIWEDISLNFIVGLPKSRHSDTILVVVERLSKYCHFIPLYHPYTAKTVAICFCEEIVRLHGMPRSIISDRDPLFLSAFWQELFKLSQTCLRMSTCYQPQTDGQTKVVNCYLEAYL